MRAVEVEVIVRAPATVVWRLVSDMDLPARFSAEFKGARWLDGATGPSAGARFLGSNEHPIVGSWQIVCTIIDYEPERRIGYVVNDIEHPAATWRFALEPIEESQVRVRYGVRIGPGPSLLDKVIASQPSSEHRIVARRLEELRTNMTDTLLGIKNLAEHGDRQLAEDGLVRS